MNTHDTLLAYSEWLDSQGLVIPDKPGDTRAHDQLVTDFVKEWEADRTKATLAGRHAFYIETGPYGGPFINTVHHEDVAPYDDSVDSQQDERI